ncbi:hypothetical protein [Sphaerotilus mobilis]|uniref:Uncharacterized protein n=1 Tax=Sphaerotilus mobilis TaxID=47994 RepID=A0A4Q7LQA1_9BURK|nr:hypothetical protein [Sphaerotilus mobilis]RZS56794.1 hypothetical protein EV685_1349 [Sphaerotilus mobilis]
MALDPQAQRRRAAVAVLSAVLDENALMQALWQLQDSMRGDAVSDIIRSVDALARQHMLDAATCRRLYNDFYKALREPEERLPIDPWPAMQATRPASASAPVAAPMYAPPPQVAPQPYWQQPQQAAPAGYAPAYPQPMPPMPQMQPMAQPMSPPGYPPPQIIGYALNGQPIYGQPEQTAAGWVAPAAAAVAAAPAPAPVVETAIAAEPPVVFGAVMRELVSEVYAFHRDALDEVQRDAMKALANAKVSAALQGNFKDAWRRARQHDWQLQGQHADLAELIKVMYAALNEAFGRVGADQILQRAIASAEGLPEARQFSPKRLMATM